MAFDISKDLDGAAAAIHNRVHGSGYADLHMSVQNKYRDIVTNTLSGVLLGRTDYADLEAIAADVIRGWDTGQGGTVPVPVAAEVVRPAKQPRMVAQPVVEVIGEQPKVVVSVDTSKKAPARSKK